MCKFQILITVNSYLMEDASTGFAVTNHRWSKLWDEYFGDSQDYKGDKLNFFQLLNLGWISTTSPPKHFNTNIMSIQKKTCKYLTNNLLVMLGFHMTPTRCLP